MKTFPSTGRCGLFLRRGLSVLLLSAAAPSLASAADLVLPPRLQGVVPGDAGTRSSHPVHARIVGGVEAEEGAWPAMVALVRADRPDNREARYCGGSLIAPNWVLTAAHCVQMVEPGVVDPPDRIEVLAGTNRTDEGGQRVAVTQVIQHPGYDFETMNHDIALLRLARALPQTPMALVDADTLDLARPGVIATVVGWGSTIGYAPGEEHGREHPDALRQVDVPIVDNAVCNAPESYAGDITANMLCAGYAEGGKDACQGDSGGPLYVPNGKGGYVQAGVVSFGEGCAHPNMYGVYARVSQYALWIRSYTDPAEGPNAAPIAYAGEDRTVSAGDDVRIEMGGTDSDGALVAAEVVQTAGLPVDHKTTLTYDNGGLSGAVLQFQAPLVFSPRTLTFQLTVRDDGGATHSDRVNVTVEPRKGGGSLGAATLFGLFGLALARRLRRG